RRVLIAGRKPDVIANLLVHRDAVIAMACDAGLRVLRLVEPDHVVRKARLVWIDSLRFEEWKGAQPEQNRISHGFELTTSTNKRWVLWDVPPLNVSGIRVQRARTRGGVPLHGRNSTAKVNMVLKGPVFSVSAGGVQGPPPCSYR